MYGRVLLIAGLVATLAACSDSEPEAEAPAADEQPAATAPQPDPAPAEPPPAAAEKEDADTAAEAPTASSSDVSTAAVDACVEAVKAETGEADVVVTSSEFSEANSIVMIGVGETRAPWKCLVSSDGSVQEVSFTGDEGSL